MKYIYLILIILISCESNPSQNRQKASKPQLDSTTYPQIIQEYQLQKYYDDAKWYIYNLYCDRLYRPKDSTSLVRGFGELELEFGHLVFQHDTLRLIFHFLDGNQPILPSMMAEPTQLRTGLGFDTVSKEKIFLIVENMDISSSEGFAKGEYPTKKEVLSYLQNTKNKTNPWFRREAQRRNIIE